MNKLLATGLVLMAAGAASAVDTYTDEATFQALLQDFYLEDFNDYFYGGYTEFTLDLGPVNGFSYTISVVDSPTDGGGDPSGQYLWSGDGSMSTQSALDALRVDFTGDDVYAVGGWFFASDIGGFYQPGETIIGFDDGTEYSFFPGSDMDFRGFVSDVPLSYIIIDAPDGAGVAWPAMDHFYVGNLIPAPTSIALLGFAGLLRRRR
jgi:hypothetical protein